MVLVDNATPPWPTVTDDSGNLTSGTKFDAAYDGSVKDTLDALLHSTADTGKSPADIIAEMKDARGNLASLNARLGGVVDADGAPVGVLAPSHIRNGFVLGNLVQNDSFLNWSRGDSSAPDHWTLSGTGAAVARCGVGLADTTVFDGQDHWSAKLTYGSATAKLTQELASAAMVAKMVAFLTGRIRPSLDGTNAINPSFESSEQTVYLYGFGHVRTTTTGIARVSVFDNAAESFSPYHDGNTALQPWRTLIAGPLQVSSAAGAIGIRVNVGGAGSAYFQGMGAFLTPLALPPMYVPGVYRYKTATYYLSGNQSTGDKWLWMPSRPWHVLGMSLLAGTAPTVSAVKYDLQTLVGAAWVSLFSTLPQIAATKYTGLQACDGTYRRRTIRGVYAADAASLPDNAALKLRCDTDDGGNTSADVVVAVHYLEQASPFDQFRGLADVSE